MDPLQLVRSGAPLDVVLAAAPMLSAILGALIPAGISLLGGLLGGKGKQKEAEGQHELGRADFERDQAMQAARAQLVRSIFGGLGIGGSIDPALLQKLGTPAAFPDRPSGGWQGAVGGALTGIAPYLAKDHGQEPESFGGTPATDAAESGGLFGPPPEMPQGGGGQGGFPMVEAETIGAGDNSDVDDYLQHFRGVSGAQF